MSPSQHWHPLFRVQTDARELAANFKLVARCSDCCNCEDSVTMPNNEKDNSYVNEWRSMWEPDLEAITYNGATCDPTKVDPKVLEWVRENCADKPRFIKVLSKCASHGWHGHGKAQYQINVPRPFVRKHYRELGRVVTLENGILNKKWKVSFGSPKKCSSWLQGWRRVADENTLQPGDVMIFVLVGHSHFRFHLFDEDGNVPGTNRKLQNHTSVKIEPSDTYHNHQEYVLTDSMDEFKHKKLRRLFDPDLAIVKIEPGLFQRSTSPEDVPPLHYHHNEPIIEPAQRGEPRVPGLRSSPDSKLTVTDGEEATARVGSACDRKRFAPNIRQRLIDSPQTAATNVDTLGEKGVTTARCAKTTSRQSDEGYEDDPVKRKLEFETTRNLIPVEEQSCLANNGITVTQQITSLQVPPQGTNANPAAAPFNPLDFFVESKRRMTTAPQMKRARDMAKAHAEFLSGYRFVLVMSEAQVYRDFYLPLPVQFVVDSKFPTVRTSLRLVDWNGSKTWEVYSRMNSCNEVSFHRKHSCIFSLEHFLEEGDVCVFQLINKDTFTFSVRIFRVLQLPKYLGRTINVSDHYELRPKPKS